MKKLLFATLTMLALSTGAFAQMPYTFSFFNQPYVPLDSATVIDSGYIWSNADNITAPIGFPFNIDTINCPNFISEGGSNFITDTNLVTFSSFLLTTASLDDRGFTLDTVSHSPIRYTMTGAPGHRIFKCEFFNAGFDQQLADIDSMTDSVDLQVWLYEDSNAVELRYGPSLITGTDYFTPVNLVGYAQDIDTASNGILYSLAGDPASPTIQTIPIVAGTPTVFPTGLTGFPPSGTVYRFGYKPGTLNVSSVFDAGKVLVYPTMCSSEVNVKYAGSEVQDYQVFSISGANMQLKGQVGNGVNHIDVSALPAGMYLLQLQGSAGSKVYKFVKI